MRLFHWTRAKSVFMPEFDAEHRNLYQIADGLHKAMSAGASPDALVPSVRALVDAAEDHFAHEERSMRAAHYPLLSWHKRQHDTARNSAKRLLARIEAGEPQAAVELLEFLAAWLKDHMAVPDRMMAAFLRSHARLHAA
jgi:hemerythrin